MDEDNDWVHMGAAYMGPSENSRLTIYSSSLYECHFKYLLLFNQVHSLNKLLWIQCSQPVAMQVQTLSDSDADTFLGQEKMQTFS
jgi:hypothetical protein